MTELILFPDAEAVIVNGLAQSLAGTSVNVPVTTGTPANRGNTTPALTFVRVTILGGSATSLTIESVQAAFDTQADDPETAAQLAAVVRSLIPGLAYLPGSPVLGTTELGRPVPFPDPLTGTPSYTQQHEIRIRGAAA